MIMILKDGQSWSAMADALEMDTAMISLMMAHDQEATNDIV